MKTLIVKKLTNKEIRELIPFDEEDRKQFRIYFNLVYDGLLDYVETHYSLTKDELRLFFLIRVFESQQEFHDLLKIEKNTLKQRKHRLKKKLMVPGKTTLTEFIKSMETRHG